MGIQHQQSSSTFKRTQDKLLSVEEELLEQQMHKNRREELDFVRRDPETRYVGGLPELTVKIDGSWSKPGFTSNFGFAVVLSARTGKVLDYQFLSKYCNKCNMRNASDPVPCQDCNVSIKF